MEWFIINELVESLKNQAVSSRMVAEKFSKKHKNVLRDIRNLLEGLSKIEHTPDMFQKAMYRHEQNGQLYPEYLMNRSGVTLLVMGFTGSEAIEWKLKYISIFNKMEAELNSTKLASPITFAEELRLAAKRA